MPEVVEIRRMIVDPEMDTSLRSLATVVNRLVDRDNGNAGGRQWLIGDDGDRQEILGGAVLDSNNYTLRVEPTSTNQVNVLHSNGSTVGLRVQDSGLTSGVPASLTSTLTVTGATTLNGAVTLGDNVADVITVTGTATFAENVTMVKNLTVDTTTLVVDATNNKVTIGSALASTGPMLDVAGTIRSTNSVPPTAGVGVEVVYNTGIPAGVINSFDRGAGTFQDLRLQALSTVLYASSTERFKVDGTGIGFFATTPAAQPAAGGAADGTLASATTLVNSLRTGLRALGLFS